MRRILAVSKFVFVVTLTVSSHEAIARSTEIARSVTLQEVAGAVFTADQASNGRTVYNENCSGCHGTDLGNGTAPPLAGPQFLSSWNQPDRTLEDLFYLIQMTMPFGAGDSLPTDQYVDVVAFVLQQNGYASGNEALTNDPALLAAVRIESQTATTAESNPAPTFIEGEGGTEPAGEGPTQAELDAADQNDRDWLYHTHDYSGSRYANLSEINRSNVSQLRPVCLYQPSEPGSFQTGPIVYDGVMYLTTPHQTVALDAASCRPLWKHVWEVQGLEAWAGTNRGVALKDGRVVRATADGYLFALDATNGSLLWARKTADPSAGESFRMPPMIYDDLILIGPAGSENAVSGWVGAFRLDDGEPVWRFDTVPGARDAIENDTWENPEDIVLGGGAVWTPLSMDLEREELYVAVTNPAPDLPANLRPGSNLYTNSIVALDVRTGELRWYEQMVPNDDHDWDLTQVSPVFNTTIDGRERNLVATVGKDGILRVLDRNTREQVYDAEVTTIENVEAPVTTDGVRACPGVLGGVEWNGPALHPGENLLYTVAVDWCATFTSADEVRFIQGENYMGGTVQLDLNPNPVPGEDPRIWQGWLTATDASTGEVRWRYRSEQPMVAAVTATGGGLVLSGELTGDFIALNGESGEVLYRFNTGGPMGGGIVTYEVEEKQYIAVMSGSPSPFWVGLHPGSPTALVFALP